MMADLMTGLTDIKANLATTPSLFSVDEQLLNLSWHCKSDLAETQQTGF